MTQLVMWVTVGNNQSCLVNLVRATGTDISGGSATVNTFAAPSGQFVYGTLPSPVTLSANVIASGAPSFFPPSNIKWNMYLKLFK